MTALLRPRVAALLAAAVTAAGSVWFVELPAAAVYTEAAFGGVTASTTLTFSPDRPDLVQVTWPQVATGDTTLSFGSSPGTDGVSVGYLSPGACPGGVCSWSGEVGDVTSGDLVQVRIVESLGDVDGDGVSDAVEHVGRAALLPPDVQRPTLSVRLRRTTTVAGRPIKVRVRFHDDQTEVGWTGDECAPGGDCDHPEWYPLMSLNGGRSWTFLQNELYSRRPRKVHVWITWCDEAGNNSAVYKSPVLKWVKANTKPESRPERPFRIALSGAS